MRKENSSRAGVRAKLVPIDMSLIESSSKSSSVGIVQALNNGKLITPLAEEVAQGVPYGTNLSEWQAFLKGSSVCGFDSPPVEAADCYGVEEEFASLLTKLKKALSEKENEIDAKQSDLCVTCEVLASFEDEIKKVRAGLQSIKDVANDLVEGKVGIEYQALLAELMSAQGFAAITVRVLSGQLTELEASRDKIEKRLAIEMALAEERLRWEAAFNKRP